MTYHCLFYRDLQRNQDFELIKAVIERSGFDWKDRAVCHLHISGNRCNHGT